MRRGSRIYAGGMNEAIRPGPENLTQSMVCLSFRSSSLPSMSVTTSPRCFGGWKPRSPVSPSRSSSSTTIRPDGTWEVVRDLASGDSRVRCIRRIGRRGLSGACIEGILASSAPCAAVIDADLQHDETQLPKMLALLEAGEADLVVGSRYVAGGSADSFNRQRAGASALATEVAKRLLRVRIADPMSGFFMIRSDRFERAGAAALHPGLQDPARYRRHRARRTRAPRKFPTLSVRGCTAKASWIRW